MKCTDILELMTTLNLFGMGATYDEVIATGIKRQHEPRIIDDLLSAEIAEKQARSIEYQLTIAQAAARQGSRRVRLRRHANKRSVDPRPGKWRLSGRAA